MPTEVITAKRHINKKFKTDHGKMNLHVGDVIQFKADVACTVTFESPECFDPSPVPLQTGKVNETTIVARPTTGTSKYVVNDVGTDVHGNPNEIVVG